MGAARISASRKIAAAIILKNRSGRSAFISETIDNPENAQAVAKRVQFAHRSGRTLLIGSGDLINSQSKFKRVNRDLRLDFESVAQGRK